MLDADFRLAVTSNGERTESHAGTQLLAWTAQPWHIAQEFVLLTNAHILERFRRGEPAETDGRESKTFALVEAAYEAAARHCAVTPRRVAED